MPMDTLSTPVRSRTPKPEADLAEWTSRIKALQRQVDADDEAEQRRLEEEIAAARRARLRRSRGAESVMNVDSSRIMPPDSGPATTEERTHQSDGSIRLTNAWHNDQRTANFEIPGSQNARMQLPLSSRKSEPMSLATFIGGRATGPRLNKHAPQQDATDPTQFDQRVTLDAPHPVFGRGGVAMPGLTGQRPSVMRAQVASNIDQVPITVRSQSRTPPVVKHDEKAREHVPASRKVGDEETRTQKTGDRRQVTVTKWAGNSDDATGSHLPRVREKNIFPQTGGGKEQPVQHQKTGSRERATSTPAGLAKSVVRPSSSSSERKIQSIRGGTTNSDRDVPSSSVVSPVNARQSYSPSNVPDPTQKHPTAIPHLARPIQPEPRPLRQSVVFPSSHVPSPAFMKQSPAKELTPSISRLKGRGFVQSIVKISSQLENPAIAPSSPPTKSRPHRKSSVLERWPPAVAPSSTPSPPVSPWSSSVTITHPSATNVPRPSSTEPVKKFLRTRASLPSISQGLTEANGAELERHASLLKKMPPDGTPGLGSATTMAIYKPSPSPVETEFTNVDELGIRTKPSSMVDAKKAHVSAELPLPSGTPLSHLTKGRAKRPRKVKGTQIASQEQEELPSRSVREDQNRVAAEKQAMLGLVIAEAMTAEVQALPMSTTIVKHFESSELHATNNDLGSSNVASRLSETAETTSTAVSPIIASITLPEQSKRTLRLGKALPGLMPLNNVTDPIPITSPPKSPPSISTDSVSITSPHKSPSSISMPHAAVRHSRPAMAGGRPTVMDVALTFNQHTESASKHKISELQILNPPVVSVPRTTSPEIKAEKRKSALDKYSSIALPALKEEATPAPSPHGTLSRDASPPNSMYSNDNATSSEKSQVPSDFATTRVLHLNYDDAPLPVVDLDHLLESSTHPELRSPHIQTISIEVLNIIGATAILISHHANIFYDTEILGIVHRSKSKIDNLVSTTLWIWRGKQSQVNDKEERKIQELARRYGTNAVMINQCSEPSQLVYLLGGQLAIRQGSRSRWTSENTMMHLVRQNNGAIYIDELDLSVQNLCSAFSYCISMLNSTYVWYGCGSNEAERQAALRYAQDFTPNGQGATELNEGESDDDDIFWMMLGGQDYARADYWKWRKEAIAIDPIIWRVQTKADPAVTQLPLLPLQKGFHEGVYIIDCIWEFFVLVGYQARGCRQDIRLALVVALDMSKKLSPNRPFSPTVHVLVLPSQLPLDLRLNFRNLDEKFINDGDVPDHMNILSASEASGHLQRLSWDIINLKDERMLPLGIDLSHVS